jgi:outer membrane protein assembly factor BamB
MRQTIPTTTGICLLGAIFAAVAAPAGDWPQWCGTDGKNMASLERGLPESFVPGEKRSKEAPIDRVTARNVLWGVKVCDALYSTPSVAGGNVFIGGLEGHDGVFACLEAASGKILWWWKAPPKEVPHNINGFSIGISEIPRQLGVCSTAAIDGDRAYFVSNRFEVVALDVRGQPPGPTAGQARVEWSYDMWDQLGVFPCDAANGSPLVDGDLVYVPTSNGVDRNTFRDTARERNRKIPAPQAPNLIVLDKRTGRLAATDGLQIADQILHGQWSSPSLGWVGPRKLIFFGAGDGRCYAFEALSSVPEKPVRLKTVWSCDCIPPEYKPAAGLDAVTQYCLGDKRVHGTLNKHDGTFVGPSEIIGTPVFVDDRVYVAIGRDPAHGRGRGALHCIDATGQGDITRSGRLWTYQGLDRTLSTASVHDGLVYLSDVAGRLHCLDALTGKCYWVHDANCETWGSTLAADGKVYMPTSKGLWVLAAGKELRVLDRINLGARVMASPVAANGTLYVASTGGWLWAVRRESP